MKHSILVVDDNSSDIELLTMVLQSLREDLEIQVARDGQEALNRLLPDPEPTPAFSQSFSLVLLDIKMPRVDGLQVLEKLKSDPRTRVLPVIMFTSSCERQDLERSYEFGANGYVVKPVDFRKYQDLLQTTLAFWLDVNTLLHSDSEESYLVKTTPGNGSGR